MSEERQEFMSMLQSLYSPDSNLRQYARTVFNQTKSESLDWLFQALTEIGVIVPFFLNHTLNEEGGNDEGGIDGGPSPSENKDSMKKTKGSSSSSSSSEIKNRNQSHHQNLLFFDAISIPPSVYSSRVMKGEIQDVHWCALQELRKLVNAREQAPQVATTTAFAATQTAAIASTSATPTNPSGANGTPAPAPVAPPIQVPVPTWLPPGLGRTLQPRLFNKLSTDQQDFLMAQLCEALLVPTLSKVNPEEAFLCDESTLLAEFLQGQKEQQEKVNEKKAMKTTEMERQENKKKGKIMKGGEDNKKWTKVIVYKGLIASILKNLIGMGQQLPKGFWDALSQRILPPQELEKIIEIFKKELIHGDQNVEEKKANNDHDNEMKKKAFSKSFFGARDMYALCSFMRCFDQYWINLIENNGAPSFIFGNPSSTSSSETGALERVCQKLFDYILYQNEQEKQKVPLEGGQKEEILAVSSSSSLSSFLLKGYLNKGIIEVLLAMSNIGPVHNSLFGQRDNSAEVPMSASATLGRKRIRGGRFGEGKKANTSSSSSPPTTTTKERNKKLNFLDILTSYYAEVEKRIYPAAEISEKYTSSVLLLAEDSGAQKNISSAEKEEADFEILQACLKSLPTWLNLIEELVVTMNHHSFFANEIQGVLIPTLTKLMALGFNADLLQMITTSSSQDYSSISQLTTITAALGTTEEKEETEETSIKKKREEKKKSLLQFFHAVIIPRLANSLAVLLEAVVVILEESLMGNLRGLSHRNKNVFNLVKQYQTKSFEVLCSPGVVMEATKEWGNEKPELDDPFAEESKLNKGGGSGDKGDDKKYSIFSKASQPGQASVPGMLKGTEFQEVLLTNIDRMAMMLGDKKSLAVSIDLIMKNISSFSTTSTTSSMNENNANNTNGGDDTSWRRRYAALQLLTYVSEGYKNELEKDLDSIVDILVECLKERNVKIKEATAICVMQLLDDFSSFGPENLAKLIPVIIRQLPTAKILKEIIVKNKNKTGGTLEEEKANENEDEEKLFSLAVAENWIPPPRVLTRFCVVLEGIFEPIDLHDDPENPDNGFVLPILKKVIVENSMPLVEACTFLATISHHPYLQCKALNCLSSLAEVLVKNRAPGVVEFLQKITLPHVHQLLERSWREFGVSDEMLVDDDENNAAGDVVPNEHQNTAATEEETTTASTTTSTVNPKPPPLAKTKMTTRKIKPTPMRRSEYHLFCCSLQCMTLMGCGIGKLLFQEYLPCVLKILCGGLKLDLKPSDLRCRYLLRGWTCVVECLGGEVAPHIHKFMPALLSICQMNVSPAVLVNPSSSTEDGGDEGALSSQIVANSALGNEDAGWATTEGTANTNTDTIEEGGEEEALRESGDVTTRVRVPLPGGGFQDQLVRSNTLIVELKELAWTIVWTVTEILEMRLFFYFSRIREIAISLLDFEGSESIQQNSAELIQEMAKCLLKNKSDELPAQFSTSTPSSSSEEKKSASNILTSSCQQNEIKKYVGEFVQTSFDAILNALTMGGPVFLSTIFDLLKLHFAVRSSWTGMSQPQITELSKFCFVFLTGRYELEHEQITKANAALERSTTSGKDHKNKKDCLGECNDDIEEQDDDEDLEDLEDDSGDSGSGAEADRDDMMMGYATAMDIFRGMISHVPEFHSIFEERILPVLQHFLAQRFSVELIVDALCLLSDYIRVGSVSTLPLATSMSVIASNFLCEMLPSASGGVSEGGTSMAMQPSILQAAAYTLKDLGLFLHIYAPLDSEGRREFAQQAEKGLCAYLASSLTQQVSISLNDTTTASLSPVSGEGGKLNRKRAGQKSVPTLEGEGASPTTKTSISPYMDATNNVISAALVLIRFYGLLPDGNGDKNTKIDVSTLWKHVLNRVPIRSGADVDEIEVVHEALKRWVLKGETLEEEEAYDDDDDKNENENKFENEEHPPEKMMLVTKTNKTTKKKKNLDAAAIMLNRKFAGFGVAKTLSIYSEVSDGVDEGRLIPSSMRSSLKAKLFM